MHTNANTYHNNEISLKLSIYTNFIFIISQLLYICLVNSRMHIPHTVVLTSSSICMIFKTILDLETS